MNITKLTKLSVDWVKYCVSQPEAGMGYQIADVTTTNGVYRDMVIQSCEFIIGTKLSGRVLNIDVHNRKPNGA